MDIGKMSEMEFRIASIKLITRVEKIINDNTESIRMEMRLNRAKLKNTMNGEKKAMNGMWSTSDALTARVTEAEERISDLEDRLMEKKETEEGKTTNMP